MKKHLFLCLFAANLLQGQDIYKLKSSNINFFAGTPIEDIDANNTKAISFLNLKSGEISISIPIKAFHFKRALMEEHFNENYLESDKYPKCEFKGKIANAALFNANEVFNTSISGLLTLHGIAQQRTIAVSILPKDGFLVGESKFQIPLSDHNIDRPQIVWEKLAETVAITANLIYEPYKK